MKNKLATLLFSVGAAAALHAAPRLRLTTTALGPVPITQGSNGTLNPGQQPYAYNTGDGTLNLKVSSSDSWLVATLGTATNTCDGGIRCTPVQLTLQTSSLAKGTYTGFVTVSDPNAVDSPQTISVTVAVGGSVPDQLTLYAPPNGTAAANFKTGNGAGASATTQTGGSWLSVAASGFGSFVFTTTFTVTADATNLAAGDYNGSVAVAGSSFAGDNKTVPVVLHVTTQPIAQPLFPTVEFKIVQNASKQKFFLAYPFYPLLTNTGQGTLSVSGGSVATTSGGSWLTLQSDPSNNGFFQITADPTGLSPGTYKGTITINSNAANSPTVIPAQMTILAAGPPAVNVGVANGFTYSPDDGLAQGDFVAIFGSQLSTGDPQTGTVPLGTTLAGTQVLMNGQAVPVQFVSGNQINIQIPYDAAIGDGTLVVVRGGQRSNTVSVHIEPAAPALYPIVFQALPSGALQANSAATPAHAGDTLVIYAVGLGATTPAVAAGVPAPTSPLAQVIPAPMVCLGGLNPIAPTALCSTPFFAGLVPGLFSEYQLNVTLPDRVPTGNAVSIFVQVGNSISNVLSIAIQ